MKKPFLITFFMLMAPVMVSLRVAGSLGGTAAAQTRDGMEGRDVGTNGGTRNENDQIKPDTMRGEERTTRFYDTLASRSQNNALAKLLYEKIFRSTDSTILSGKTVDEELVYEPFRGKRIASISVVREGVFADNPSRLARWANRIHITTRHRMVENYLLFNEGDEVDPALMVKNKQLFNMTDFIYRADIELYPDYADTTMVNITVRTHDRWTLGVDVDYDPTDHSFIELYDADMLGTGHRLSVAANFSGDFGEWGGIMAGYTVPNLFGTFFAGEITVGRNFYNKIFSLASYKNFIRPTDYAGGLSYSSTRIPTFMICYDTTQVVGLNTFDAWAGGSRYIPAMKSSLFGTMHLYKNRYTDRPEVGPGENPGYHNTTRLIAGLGLYREKYYTTTLIYGYGNNEYLPAGYKAGLVGGYSWEQFGGNYYMGFDLSGGIFRHNGGYITGSLSMGSFLSDGEEGSGKWNRSSLSAQAEYVTRLLRISRSRVRNLLKLSYMHGWNRMTGCDETVGFTKTEGLRGFTRYVNGRNRLLLNDETVVFTPLAPYGFRIAIFSYTDLGVIGNNDNAFANDFYGSIGAGIRIHNDRLIFPPVQIRLGFFFGKPGWINGEYITLTSQKRLKPPGFAPVAPDIEPYR